jgi:DNA-binding NarL/FixJ family response regulator
MTSVLLVDDHAVVRAGLAALLGSADHMEVVAQAADGQEGVELAARLRPDVVLMDLSMPVLDGVAATKRIAAEVPGTSVVVLTSFADRRHVTEAMSAGAVGYLVKDCDPREIITAVRSAARGKAPIDARVAAAVEGAQRQAPVEAAQRPTPAPSATSSTPPRRFGLWRRVTAVRQYGA